MMLLRLGAKMNVLLDEANECENQEQRMYGSE